MDSAYLAAVSCDFTLLALQRLATDIFLDLSTLEAAIKAVRMECVHLLAFQSNSPRLLEATRNPGLVVIQGSQKLSPSRTSEAMVVEECAAGGTVDLGH